MAIRVFLAMTGAEFAAVSPIPEKVAWMACHFSQSGKGITDLPPALPAGSLLILDDRIPLQNHNADTIAVQLQQSVDETAAHGVLLDFQRPGMETSAVLASKLVNELSCQVIVSEQYAKQLDCPVFLSPCPHHMPLDSHLANWMGREIWLDFAADAETIILEATGSQIHPVTLTEFPEGGHKEPLLHCHYRAETGATSALFTLWRTCSDLQALAEAAEILGVSGLVGLYRELSDFSIDSGTNEMQKPPRISPERF